MGISRLVARVRDSSARSTWRLGRVAFSLPDDFVELEPTEPGAAAPMPHVFLYLVDTLRADALAAYGGEPGLTPSMNAFGDGAVVYEDARVASSWTLPSVVSILTGVYPFRHHVMKGDVKFDTDVLPGLGRLLAERGYETVAISQSFVVSGAFGIDRDFEDFFLNNQLHGHKLGSQSIRKALVHWLAAPGREEGAPIFAYLHSVDPHAPYSPPPGYRELAESAPGTLPPAKYRPSVFMTERRLASMPREVEHLEALYLGEVSYTDRQFGLFLDLLRRLDLYDPSLILLVSDHGEEFAEHGGFDHGRTLYDELLEVPLIAKFPQDRWADTRVARPVSTVDILPTVLALTGEAEAVVARHGESLIPDDAAPGAPRRGIFAEVNPAAAPHAGAVDLRALAVSGLKCIQNMTGVDQFGRRAPEWSVYDLGADPGEQETLAPATVETRRCREALVRWLAARQAADEALATGAATSEETREHLRALGYIQ
jgi:arylsulfatase A-like enzyme